MGAAAHGAGRSPGFVLAEDITSVQDATRQFVICMVAGGEYGVAATSVREISPLLEISAAPAGADGIEGVANFRGGAIPVIDARKRLGREERELTDEAPVVVVEVSEQCVGLLVDGVHEVLRDPSAQIFGPESLAIDAGGNLGGVVKVGERLIVLLRPAAFAVEPALYAEIVGPEAA